MVLSALLYTNKPLLAEGKERELSQIIKGINDQYAQRRCISLEYLIASCATLSESEKLVKVNNFFNQIPYQSDRRNWGVEDYWAAPLETLIKGKADCEDYAIGKFCTLIKMGIPQDRLFLTYVRLKDRVAPHFVVTYYESKTALPRVLDNLKAEILPACPEEGFEMVYRFNLKEFISCTSNKEYSRPLESVKFEKWRELYKRLSLI